MRTRNRVDCVLLKLCSLIGFWLVAAGSSDCCWALGLLSNAGFETDASGQHKNIKGWQTYGVNTYNQTGSSAAHAGSNYFKIYQSFSGGVNYSGIYQDTISGPGAVYRADGWAFTSSSDVLAGNNAAWIEVSFRDAAANVLSLYRSAAITTNGIASGTLPKDKWFSLVVTNQFNPITYQITNTASELVAPDGTVFVRFQIVFQGDAGYSGGSVYFDDLRLEVASGSAYGNLNIVWCDEFDKNTIDTGVWTYDLGGGGWGNNELEYYTRRTNNVYQSNGYLHIRANKESYNGYAYTSARVKSQGLFSIKYGRIEWRASTPQGVGFWPALWMLGTNITSISWPGCGEIDVMENNGKTPGRVAASLHSGSDATETYDFLDGSTVTNFHTYTVDWTTNAILFYVDGHLFERVTSWSSSKGAYPFPFDQPFFLIMNMAVGGNYLGNPSSSTVDAGTQFPGEMLVDYVRLYRLTEPFKMSLYKSNSEVLISWPTNIVSRLQGQQNIAGASVNWQTVDSTNNQARILPVDECSFFRLVTP